MQLILDTQLNVLQQQAGTRFAYNSLKENKTTPTNAG